MSMRPPSRNVKEATGYMSLKVAEARDGERFPVPVWSRLVRLNDLGALVWWGQEAFLRVS